MSFGRLERFSKYLDAKYNLISVAESKKVSLDWIKRQLTDMVKTYIANPPVAYNIVPLLAQRYNDPFCKALIDGMVDLVRDIKSSSPELLFEQIASLSEMITEEKNNKQEIRNTIHSYFTKPNEREMAKNKFEAVVFEKIQNLLKQNGQELAKLDPKADFDTSRLGVPSDRQPKELSKQEMWIWIHGHPAAGKYGLDNEDVFAKVYEDLDLRRELTKLIYATNRARSPRQTANVKKAVEEFMRIAKQKITNEGYFEAGEEAAKEFARPKWVTPTGPKPINEKEFVGPDPGYDPGFVAERNRQEAERLKLHERNRLEEEERKQQEEDRERHVRSEGSALLRALIKKRYL